MYTGRDHFVMTTYNIGPLRDLRQPALVSNRPAVIQFGMISGVCSHCLNQFAQFDQFVLFFLWLLFFLFSFVFVLFYCFLLFLFCFIGFYCLCFVYCFYYFLLFCFIVFILFYCFLLLVFVLLYPVNIVLFVNFPVFCCPNSQTLTHHIHNYGR